MSTAGEQLIWRGTFIDGWAKAGGEGAAAPLRPRRVRSAPLPLRPASSAGERLFGQEWAYLQGLPARAAVLSGGAGLQRRVQQTPPLQPTPPPGGRRRASRVRRPARQTARRPRELRLDDLTVPAAEGLSGEISDGDSTCTAGSRPDSSAAHSSSSLSTAASDGLRQGQAKPKQPDRCSSPGAAARLRGAALARSGLRLAPSGAQRQQQWPMVGAEDLLGEGPKLPDLRPQEPRVAAAAAALRRRGSVPELLEEAARQLAARVLGDVRAQGSELCGHILTPVAASRAAPGSASADAIMLAVGQVIALPEAVLAALRSGAIEARRTVEQCMTSLEREIHSQPASYGQSEQMARRAAAIPEQIREAACQAFESALHAAKAWVTRHLESALAPLTPSPALVEGKARLLSSVPTAVPDEFAEKAMAAARQWLQQTFVALPRLNMASRTVTDAQLRTKASAPGAAAPAPTAAPPAQPPRAWAALAPAAAPPQAAAVGPPQRSAAPARAAKPLSAGSLGHPFLCVRPCVFQARGFCGSGAACVYCHGAHDTKPRHLDKIGRDVMKRLPFAQRVSLTLPILRDLAAEQGFGPQASGLLATLEASARAMGLPARHVLPEQMKQRLERSLRALSFRSVLGQACQGADTPEGLQGEPLFEHLRRIIAGLCDAVPRGA